jgi:hypothetical protein
MTTSIWLVAMVALLVAGGVILLRGSRLKKMDKVQRIVLSTVIGVGILFLAWLAIMVLVVGPSMRAM